jgi:5-(carboxyamino)imidazole ribonucleotide synthase
MNLPMANYFSTNFKLGILGGGQLGKMLLTETRKYDIYTKVLDPSPHAPGRLGSNEFFVGDLAGFETVYQFGKDVDVLTIEIEHVNIEALEKLEAEGVNVYPKPGMLHIIQNKLRQKRFYKGQNIPTSKFEVFPHREEVLHAVETGRWKMPFVWKSARGGYDGFGVVIVHTEADLEKIEDDFCVVEEYVPFEKELSVIVARNESGEMATYPVVEMEFHPTANQVEYVLSPGMISDDLAEKARNIALQTAEAYQLIGLLAVEMFLTKEGEILVNEVAPRTHNSGHVTIENNYTSQFEQHLRAILNLPLGDTRSKTPAVMANLVGAEGYSGEVVYKGYEDLMHMPGVNIHIYGKRVTRPFRKMGHVTVIAPTLKEARLMAEKAKQGIQVISAQ